MDNNWYGIMKILEVQVHDPQGVLLYEEKNIKNLLHIDGEAFLLRAAFIGGRVSTVIPDNYYLGLDNRGLVQATDTINDLVGEPTIGGYARQAISSSGDFTLSLNQGHYTALSPIVAFRATTSGWGPVNNLFITDKIDLSGSLISTAILQSSVSLGAGSSVTMRLGMQLKDCPT